jgi:membrane protein
MNITKKTVEIFTRVKHFVTDEVWSVRLENYPKGIATLLTYLRVVLVSVRRFDEDRVQLRASSLTYYSLLAIVPILAMGFGIAKGFGYDKDLEQKLIENFQGHEEVLDYIITFAHSMLDNAKGGVIAGVGLAVLFWSVMKMMINIESSLNDIWQIKKGRSYIRKFTDYVSIMLVAPLLIILASSGKVYLATQLNDITSGIEVVNLSPFVVFLMNLLPYLMIWLLFALIYVIMPNTRVKFSSVLLAGILAGTAFLVGQWLYIETQMLTSRINIIYGSFAALPLLFIWLRVSWLIFLLGAEVSFAKQNIDQYELENESRHISLYAHRAYCILLLENIVRRFIDGEKPLTATEISNRMKLPIRLVRMVTADLLACNLVSEVCTTKDNVRAYAPAKDVRQYSVKFVIEALEKSGNSRILNKPTDELSKVLHIQENILRVIEQAPENILLQDMSNYRI